MFAGPVDVFVVADLQQQIQLLGKQLVIVLELEPEQREGIGERASAHDHLGAPVRDEIECGEILEYANRVGRAQDCHCAGESYAARSCRGSGENDGRSGVEKILAVMFADSEDIEPNLIGVLDLLDQVAQTLCRTELPAGLSVRCCKTVYANLHSWPPPPYSFSDKPIALLSFWSRALQHNRSSSESSWYQERSSTGEAPESLH